jgi:hypothetical protein
MAVLLKDVDREAKRAVNRAYERFQEAGEFDFEDFRASLPDTLQHLDLEVHAYQGYLDKLAADADDRARKARSRPNDQPMLPGLNGVVDVDGVYCLGGGRRVAKRLARKDHMETVIQLSAENRDAVILADIALRQEYDALAPYWRGETTKEQALATAIADLA